jgi:hypothetical protein
MRDLGLLPRITKGLQVLVARMRDIVLLRFATLEETEWKPQIQSEVEDDNLYPPPHRLLAVGVD